MLRGSTVYVDVPVPKGYNETDKEKEIGRSEYT